MADCREGQIPSQEAKFFHSLPHGDFNFDNISTTFRPTDKDYQQNLLLYSGIGAVFGVILFIMLGIYSIVHCCKWCCKRCKKQITKRKNRTKWAIFLSVCIWVSSLISCGCAISAFIFSDDINKGVITVTVALDNVSNTFENIHDEVSSIQNNIIDIKENIDEMVDYPGISFIVVECLKQIESSILNILEELHGVKPIRPPEISSYVKTGEYYRWWSVFGVLMLSMMACLIAVYSSIRYSRFGFFLALLLGCFAFLLDWLLIGVHLGLVIGISDLCISPRETINFYIKSSSIVTKNIVNYYLDCKPHSIHPFYKFVDSSLDFVHNADEILQKLRNESWAPLQKDIQKLTIDLNNIETTLDGIQENLKCTNMKKQYNKAHCAVCFPVMEGITLLLVVSVVFAMFLLIVVLLITFMCRRIHKKRRPSAFMNPLLNGNQSEETDYYSAASDEESMPLLPSNSPPPYESVAGTGDFQFHSCCEDRHRTNSASSQPDYQPRGPAQQDITASNQQNNFAPPPLRGEVVIQRKITMAF